jgi:diaminohydroxyphosphoribosylaminopyrimidine deaminase/5-amino-6-(5-phosphoribosylamino)uracil reductase
VESHIANHQYFMQRAIQLAAKGLGRTSPNPVVGAVLVKNKRVVGEGFHRQAGGPHAELLALAQAGEQASGATMYVSLEPCCHHGRTPPCVPEIVKAGVANVVVGLIDPDPRVSGGGLRELRAAGVAVELADEDSQEQCAEVNRAFICRLKRGRPYVTLKFASSLDGKIASRTGRSKYISGDEARRWVHRERDSHDAIMVGINTLRVDDPELTAREPEGRTPIKIVVDSSGRLPENARIWEQAENGVIALTTPRGQQKIKPRDGLELIVTEGEHGLVDLSLALEKLAERGINSILLEGGSRLNGSMLDRGLIDRVAGFVAPILVGGQEAVSPIGGFGVDCVGDALRLRDVGWSTLGPDLLIEGFLWMPSDEIEVPTHEVP